jgi:DNA-binding protein H-NS
MTSYRDMKAQITKLEKQAADLFKKEVAEAISKIKALMDHYGLSVRDLGMGAAKAVRGKASSKPASAPKYQDPVSGKTWTGHGKAPGWLVSAVQAGKSRDDFLIGKPVAKAKTPAKATKAAATKAPAKKAKPAVKAVAKTTASKPAPVVKAKAPSKPVAKPVPAKKPAAKPAAKPVAAKAPVKKAAAKPAVKPAAKVKTVPVTAAAPVAATSA